MPCVLRSILIGLVLLLTASQLPPATAQSSRPNVVLILADDMGYGDVQALNPESRIPTPHLNRLAEQGMLFTDAHTPSSVCTPTRYGLLTGRYCWRTRLKRGVLGGYSEPLIESDRHTLGNLFQQFGYRTAAIGKWHLGMGLPMLGATLADRSQWAGDPGVDFAGRIERSPISNGFASYFGVCASLDMAPYVFVRDDHFSQQPMHQQPAVAFPHFVRAGPRADDFVIDEVLDRLVTEAKLLIASASQQDRPFFLYLPLTAPHKPTQPHPRFRGQTELGEYGDFVFQVDSSVGQILQALEQQEVSQNTLVVFTSDNGSYMVRFDDPAARDHVTDSTIQGFRADRHRANGPLRGTKADIYEAGHRVPMIVRWPGKIAAGERCTATVCLTDWYATFAELLGATVERGQAPDSVSLVPALQGAPHERRGVTIHHSVNGMFAVRKGPWKLILGNGSGGRERPVGAPFEHPYQLYNLQADLGETDNRAEEAPDQVMQLLAEFESVREQ